MDMLHNNKKECQEQRVAQELPKHNWLLKKYQNEQKRSHRVQETQSMNSSMEIIPISPPKRVVPVSVPVKIPMDHIPQQQQKQITIKHKLPIDPPPERKKYLSYSNTERKRKPSERTAHHRKSDRTEITLVPVDRTLATVNTPIKMGRTLDEDREVLSLLKNEGLTLNDIKKIINESKDKNNNKEIKRHEQIQPNNESVEESITNKVIECSRANKKIIFQSMYEKKDKFQQTSTPDSIFAEDKEKKEILVENSPYNKDFHENVKLAVRQVMVETFPEGVQINNQVQKLQTATQTDLNYVHNVAQKRTKYSNELISYDRVVGTNSNEHYYNSLRAVYRIPEPRDAVQAPVVPRSRPRTYLQSKPPHYQNKMAHFFNNVDPSANHVEQVAPEPAGYVHRVPSEGFWVPQQHRIIYPPENQLYTRVQTYQRNPSPRDTGYPNAHWSNAHHRA